MSHEVQSDFQPVVETLTELSQQDVEDFARLLPQLTSHPDTDLEVIGAKLSRAISAEDTAVMVIRDVQGRIQASATANICRIPTGEKPWVDDVVTDNEHRGRGYGRLLMVGLHDWFLERGVDTSNLTSNPERLAAGNLYESLGYQERATRVYRAKLAGGVAVKSNL